MMQSSRQHLGSFAGLGGMCETSIVERLANLQSCTFVILSSDRMLNTVIMVMKMLDTVQGLLNSSAHSVDEIYARSPLV